MKLILKKSIITHYIIPILITLLFLYFIKKNLMFAFKLSVILLVGIILINRPKLSLYLIILLIPFNGMELMHRPIGLIPGLKLHTLVVLAIGGILLFTKKIRKLRIEDIIFFSGVSIILSVATFRSLTNSIEINSMFWGNNYDLSTYLNTHLITPLMILLPYLYILFFVNDIKEIHTLIHIIIFSMLILSVVIITLYVINISNINSDYEYFRSILGQTLGLHGNDIANFYLITYTLILANTLARKKILNIITLFITFIGIGLLFSRTAYILVLISTFLFILFSKRKKIIPYLLIIMLLGFSVLKVTPIGERILYGFDSSSVDINSISAGRTSDIWEPLIKHLSDNPKIILFGYGLHGIWKSTPFISGYMLQVGHAHNMYLNIIFDTGLIGLIFFLIYYAWYLIRIRKTGEKYDQDIILSIKISIIAYLISGLSGRTFFPRINNAVLWIIIALGQKYYLILKRDKKMLKKR